MTEQANANTAPAAAVVGTIDIPAAELGGATGLRPGFLNSKDFTVFIGTTNPLTEKFVSAELLSKFIRITYNVPVAGGTEGEMERKIIEVDRLLSAVMALVLAIGRTMMMNRRSEDNIKLLLVGELLSPKMSIDKRSPEPQILITAIVNHILATGSSLFVDECITICDQVVQLPVEWVVPSYETALTVLYSMAMSLKINYQTYLRDTHIEYYISMATRGNISDNKITKIQTALSGSAGYTPALSASRIRSYYQHHGSALTATNAKNYLNHWEDLISETALQLKLVLGQAMYGGLTQFTTIGLAMIDFDDFPWDKLDKAFPGEFANFNHAIEKIKGNPYYGYVRDLGDVAAHNYKNLAWASKELLIRSGGHDSLKSYAGWAKSCLHKLAVNQLIDDYLGKRADDLNSAASGPRSSEQNRTRALLKANFGIFKGEDQAKKRPRPPDDGEDPNKAKKRAERLAKTMALGVGQSQSQLLHRVMIHGPTGTGHSSSGAPQPSTSTADQELIAAMQVPLPQESMHQDEVPDPWDDVQETMSEEDSQL